jgi:hypothetical protein
LFVVCYYCSLHYTSVVKNNLHLSYLSDGSNDFDSIIIAEK